MLAGRNEAPARPRPNGLVMVAVRHLVPALGDLGFSCCACTAWLEAFS
jgi:hypothetical protein